jgi:phosphatidylserine decarboxylase
MKVILFNIVLDPIESFQNFNQFFYRKLKPDARMIASPEAVRLINKEIAICPADARTNCFPSIKASTELWIKGSKFSVESLLGSDELALPFKNGSLAIFRLAPQDYHRFHFPVDGIVTHNSIIEGTYFTVNPMAVRSTVDVFTENARSVTIIDSTHHGKVAYVCIGAMMVGSIVLTSKTGQVVQRMDEHGYFKFGGSTIVLVFEKDKIEFDRDLLENSKTCLETLVKVGNSLGSIPRQKVLQ